ncbi:MAG TPA: hypothetical protein VGI30_14095 [Caulobacteraceae bacterium]|jgi:hypothetical protein
MRSNLLLVLLMAAAPAAAMAQSAQPAPATQTPEEVAIISALQRVCFPLSRGAKVDTVAAASGLRQENGQWVLPIRGPEQIVVTPPDFSNPTVCTATITYDPAQDNQLVGVIDSWAKTQTPPLKAVKVKAPESGPVMQRLTSSWQALGPKETDGVVLSQEKTLQGQPVDGKLDQAELLVSVTPTKPS